MLYFGELSIATHPLSVFDIAANPVVRVARAVGPIKRFAVIRHNAEATALLGFGIFPSYSFGCGQGPLATAVPLDQAALGFVPGKRWNRQTEGQNEQIQSVQLHGDPSSAK